MSKVREVVLAAALATAFASCAAPPAPTSPPDANNPHVIVSPDSSAVLPRAPVAIRINTHCGLDRAIIDYDRSLWSVREAQPPPRLADPFESGTITLLGPNLARFESDGGIVLLFDRRPASVEIVPCR